MQAQVAKLEAKVKELEVQNRALLAAKSLDEANGAMSSTSEIEQFKELAEAAAEAVSSLSRPVRLASIFRALPSAWLWRAVTVVRV